MAIPSKNIRAERITGSLDANGFSISGSLNFTGSLQGTASFAISSSFSTSASFASTTSVNTATLTFFHNQVTNTTSSRVSYIGGFAAPPETVPTRIALHAPFNGTITHCVISSFVPTTSSISPTAITCALSVNGGATFASLSGVDLTQFTDNSIIPLNTAVTAGDKINIRLTETANSSAVWGINAVLILKS